MYLPLPRPTDSDSAKMVPTFLWYQDLLPALLMVFAVRVAFDSH